jgi:UDP-N-acetylmuramate--alanine ligase
MEGQRRRQPALGRIRQVHMVGIGGIGMSSIAEVLLNRGYEVTGSDLTTSDVTAHLRDLGATIYEGHAAEQIGEADVVVYSSAVDPEENPETREAERRRISLIPRAEMLGELIRMKFGVGIAGTHGKTTTTSMAGLVAAEGGFDPTVIVGGKVTAFGSNAVTGEGDIIVIEADEYDRTFLRLTPSLAVVTNIEEDHLDVYDDLADIQEAFVEYANSVPFFGAAILCLDDPNVQEIVGAVERRVLTFGTTRQAEVRAANVRRDGVKTRFDVVVRGDAKGTVELQVPGMHNVRNALAAVAVGFELDIPFDEIRRALAAYDGVRRRFETVGRARSVRVIDDYAHHPTEVEATLDAATQGFADRRIVAVFQPHLYSRTRDFADAFARSFFNADVLVLTEIYGAREAPIEGVTGEVVADRAAQYGHRDVRYVPDLDALPERLLDIVEPGDVVLMLGAGDIWRASRDFVERLEAGDADPLPAADA